MKHQAEFDFVQTLLKTYRLNIYLFDNNITPANVLPEYAWLGEYLIPAISPDSIYSRFKNKCSSHIVYQIEDGFLCHHIVFLLSDEEENPVYAYIGPYTQDSITKQHITKLAEKFRIPSDFIPRVEHYYQNLPYLADETHLLSIVYSFCSLLWGGTDKFTIQQLRDFLPVNFDIVLKNITSKESSDSAHDGLYLEERYDIERQMMQAVSTGQIPKAELMFATISKFQFESRSTNVLRNVKNYLIILNTLLRIAARNGDVPPFHIDRLSSAYAHKIEATTSLIPA